MKEKIVVLNSGGFDSVVLMNYLHFIQGEDNIYSLHFLYGARNEKQQLECVNKVCEKVKADNKIIELPEFNWTKSNFYEEGYNSIESQYLEYRNLIFLSYAVSYAQSIGAKIIYCAFLNMAEYTDTNLDFLCGLNRAIEQGGIQIEAPFIYDTKNRIGHIANYLNIREDFFSCDTPINNKPCGKCEDCKNIEKIKKIKVSM